MKENTFIYALRNPTTKKVFYIGKADDPKKRLSNHLYKTKDYFNIPELYLHLKSIIDNNQTPDLILLEKVSQSEWEEKEKFYIKEHTERGVNLLNLSIGGKVFGNGCFLRSVEKMSKPILQYDLNGEFICEFPSIREAFRKIKCAKSTIYSSLNTSHKTAKGSYWRFKISEKIPKTITVKGRIYTTKPVYMMLADGSKKTWESIKDAAFELNVHQGALANAIRKGTTIRGYKVEKDLSSKRWKNAHGKLNQKLVNYSYIDPSEYSQFN